MQKELKDKHFIKKPVYEGGPKAMKAFIRENLKYPKAALSNRVEGTVTVTYTIARKGEVIDAKVIAGLGHGCDEEAIRLVKLFKFKMPKNRAARVKFHKTIHIHFRLTESTAPTSTQIQYSYSQKKEETPKKEEPAPRGNSYSFIINY